MSSKFSLEEYVHLGKQAYREKRYKDALSHYQKALQLEESLDILDALAAIHEKLGNTGQSLKHGKKMLQYDEKSTRGYLRIGRTLQAKPEWKVKELAIYDRGLEKTAPSDAQYKLLVSMQQRLKRELYPPATYDPLIVLPSEIVHMIFEYLEFNILVRALRVSKDWHRILTTQPWLWNKIDITSSNISFQKRLPAALLLKWMKWSNFKVRHAILGRYSHSNSILALATKCKSLQTLDMNQSSIDKSITMNILKATHNLRSFTCQSMLSFDEHLFEILMICKSLEHLDVQFFDTGGPLPLSIDCNFPQLRSLRLTGRAEDFLGLRPAALQKMLDLTPNMNELWLNTVSIRSIAIPGPDPVLDLSGMKSLDSLCLQNIKNCYLWLPPSLEVLVVNRARPFRIEKLAESWFPRLRSILLSACYNIIEILEALLKEPTDQSKEEQDCPFKDFCMVQRLELGAMIWDNQPVMDALFPLELRRIFQIPRLQRLEQLTIDAPEVDDEVIQVLVQHIQTLQVLHLKNASLTGIGVKMLVRSQQNLNWLIFDNCPSISADAIEWARHENVNVKHTTRLEPRKDGRTR